MNRALIGLVAFAVMMAPAMAADVEVPITPSAVGPGNSGPSTHLAYRAFDIGIDIDGSGSTVNPTNVRPSFYAFTGEKLMYYVLVRDDNGADDIVAAGWTKDNGAEEGPCDELEVSPEDDAYFCLDASKHWYDCPEDQKVYVDTATNLKYDCQTDKIYYCVLTVESQWNGAGDIQIKAVDTSGAVGAMLSERWTFNPALTISVETSNGQALAFGERIKDQSVPGTTTPNCERTIDENLMTRTCSLYDSEVLPEAQKLCDISFSTNKVVLKNNAIVNMWPYIAGENFYDSTGMAKCPTSNELDANQFEYNAVMGTFDSGWRVMPQYSPNLGCYGPTLSDSCRGGCRIATGCPFDVLTPQGTLEVAFKIVWPTPCIGTFDTGAFHLIVRAV